MRELPEQADAGLQPAGYAAVRLVHGVRTHVGDRSEEGEEACVMIKKDSVVQILPNEHSPNCFDTCLMVVTEVKSWGYQGYIPIPGKMKELPALAGYRVKKEDCVHIGEALLVIDHRAKEDGG